MPTPTSETNENATTLDSTIQKYCAAEQLNDKLEIREETEEEKQARLEMEAEVKKMLDNLPPFVKRVVRTVKPLGIEFGIDLFLINPTIKTNNEPVLPNSEKRRKHAL